jgi:hypothetical protein
VSDVFIDIDSSSQKEGYDVGSDKYVGPSSILVGPNRTHHYYTREVSFSFCVPVPVCAVLLFWLWDDCDVDPSYGMGMRLHGRLDLTRLQ